MGKTFENLSWDDLCDLMCGEPEPIRQTDNIRVTKRCYTPTVYTQNELSYVKKQTCPYLVDGECELNFCVRKN